MHQCRHCLHRVWLGAVAWVRRRCPRVHPRHTQLQCGRVWTRAAAGIEHGYTRAVHGSNAGVRRDSVHAVLCRVRRRAPRLATFERSQLARPQGLARGASASPYLVGQNARRWSPDERRGTPILYRIRALSSRGRRARVERPQGVHPPSIVTLHSPHIAVLERRSPLQTKHL